MAILNNPLLSHGRKFITVVFVVVALVIGAPIAHSQETNAYEQGYEQCLNEQEFTRGNSPARVVANVLPDAVSEGLKKGACMDNAASENPGAALATAVGAAASKFWGDPVGKLTQAVLEGNSQALQTVMTFWMDYRIDKNTIDQNVNGVKNIVLGLAGLALIASIIVGGGRMAASRRQGLAEGLENTGQVIATYLLFSLLIPGMIAGAVVASDQLSDWIMRSFGATSAEQILGGTALKENQAGPIIMLALAGVSFAGSMMQLIALATRTLLLPIAAGLTPLFAALTFTQTGKQGLNHLVSLIIASIAFKPISALLYSVTFWYVKDGGDGVMDAFVTAIMIGAAGFTAPALVRAIAPVVSQAGGGGAAPVLAGGAALTGGALGLAGGALNAASRGLSSSGGKAAGAASTAAGSGASMTATGTGGSGGAVGSNPGGGGGRVSSPTSQNTTAGGSVSGRSSSGASSTGASGGGGATATGASSAAGGSGPSPQMRPAGASGVGGQGATTQSRSARVGSQARQIGATTARTGAGVANTGARMARSGAAAAQRIQSILDESIGAQGTHHGGRR